MTSSTSRRRTNAAWTPSMDATWPTEKMGARSSNRSCTDPLHRRQGGVGVRGDGGRCSVGALDGHSPRLGLLRDGQTQGQDAVAVVGLDAVGVERLAEEELTAERAVLALADQHLHAVLF